MPPEADAITLAVLGEKLDALTSKIDERDDRFNESLVDHEQRLRCNENNITKLQQGQGVWGGALAVLSLVGSSIAAWLGGR